MYTTDEIVELLENNLRMHKLVDEYESFLEKLVVDYTDTKKKVSELQTKIDELTNENEKLKNENSLLTSLHKDKVNVKPEKEEYKFDCVNAYKIYQQMARDIMYNNFIPFNDVPIGAVFSVKGNSNIKYVKLASLDSTTKSLPEQKPNALNLNNQHYITCGRNMLCKVEKRREDY